MSSFVFCFVILNWFLLGFEILVGMNEDSSAFAGELFDALSRRRNIKGDVINKTELKDFWDQIADQSFDSRLQTFFDM